VDYLIHQGTIPSLIVVMVPPVQRTAEYQMNSAFVDFFVTEVVATIDGRYRTRPSPECRGLIGDSLGGLAAIYVAFSRPDVFGKSAGQSGAYFDSMITLVRDNPKRDVVFHLDIGTYETGVSGVSLLDLNRRMREVMVEKGYSLQYLEVHEGHSWGSWRARIDEALKFFWGNVTKS
jgi:enterochelin esterase family protein